MRLLTRPKGNTKFKKSHVRIYGLSLAPAKMASSTTVCPSSTPGCRATCLVFSGMAQAFPMVLHGRILKTQLFFSNQEKFMVTLNNEIASVKHREGRRKLAFRLNVFSDIAWETIPDSPIVRFPHVQFYDYTKIPSRYEKFLAGQNWPANYHLTFSRSEKNEKECLDFLRMGGTVSLVYDRHSPIETYLGFPVAEGDSTDYRPDDPPGHWIGLRSKGTLKIRATAEKLGFSLS